MEHTDFMGVGPGSRSRGAHAMTGPLTPAAASWEMTVERDKLVVALEILINELEPWLTEADAGLPAVIKTLGDCANLHTAQRKARAVLDEARKP